MRFHHGGGPPALPSEAGKVNPDHINPPGVTGLGWGYHTALSPPGAGTGPWVPKSGHHLDKNGHVCCRLSLRGDLASW